MRSPHARPHVAPIPPIQAFADARMAAALVQRRGANRARPVADPRGRLAVAYQYR